MCMPEMQWGNRLSLFLAKPVVLWYILPMGHVFSFPERKRLIVAMNSPIARDYLMRNRRSNIHLYPEDWKTLPIPDVDTQTQSQITALVTPSVKRNSAITLHVSMLK